MTLLHFFHFISVDPSLGRIDKFSLSQQTLMELLIVHITNRSAFFGSAENPKELSEWMGVSWNESNEVTAIDWTFRTLEGSIEFPWFPNSLQDVKLAWNKLSGSADLTCLPKGLQTMNIACNHFAGSVDLTNLPPSMKELYIFDNNFRGVVDFSQLPKSLTWLNISKTRLEGTIFHFDGHLFTTGTKVKDMRPRETNDYMLSD